MACSSNTTWCELENGTVTTYQAACKPDSRPYEPYWFEYIGDGVIYAVGDIIQPGREKLSFFKLIKRKKKSKYHGRYE